MIYRDIPHRVWRGRKFGSLKLVTQPVYRRVMKRVGDAMAAGRTVEMDHQIVNPVAAYGKPYDTITIRISE